MHQERLGFDFFICLLLTLFMALVSVDGWVGACRSKGKEQVSAGRSTCFGERPTGARCPDRKVPAC